MSALLAELPVPADVQATLLGYAVSVSIDDPVDELSDPEDDEEDENLYDGIVEGLGWKGAHPCNINVSATIRLGDAKIGSAKLTIVERATGDGAHFHDACDAESQELLLVAAAFFGADGTTPRLAAVKALGDEVRTGPVCYLASFSLDDPRATDPTSDVAAEALAKLLAAGPLADEWAFCVYIPEAAPHRTAAEKAAGQNRRFEDARTREERRADEEADQAYIRRDAEPFLRLGFAQAEELSGWGRPQFLYVARSQLRAEPLARAAAPALASPPAPPLASEPTEADQALRAYLSTAFMNHRPYGASTEAEYLASRAMCDASMEKIRTLVRRASEADADASEADRAALNTECDGLEATILAVVGKLDAADAARADEERAVAAEIRRHVDELGATVSGARAVHIAAASNCALCLDVLLELGGPGSVDAPDPANNGVAPLSVAAATILGKASRSNTPPLTILRALLQRGANADATDHKGLTALGHFWTSKRENRDFSAKYSMPGAGSFGYDRDAFEDEIEGLVTPAGGPTPADEAARDED